MSRLDALAEPPGPAKRALQPLRKLEHELSVAVRAARAPPRSGLAGLRDLVEDPLMTFESADWAPPQFVFKICRTSEWRALQTEQEWWGSPHDVRDGFIHLSTQAQVAGTLAKHFAGEADLVLLRIASAELESRLRWEPSRGGELFPHLFAPLVRSMVTQVPFEDLLSGVASDR